VRIKSATLLSLCALILQCANISWTVQNAVRGSVHQQRGWPHSSTDAFACNFCGLHAIVCGAELYAQQHVPMGKPMASRCKLSTCSRASACCLAVHKRAYDVMWAS
jgi:hypothetical protein